MKEFFRCEPHLEAMRLSTTIAREVRVLTFETFTSEEAENMAFDTAKSKLRAEGKVISFVK